MVSLESSSVGLFETGLRSGWGCCCFATVGRSSLSARGAGYSAPRSRVEQDVRLLEINSSLCMASTAGVVSCAGGGRGEKIAVLVYKCCCCRDDRQDGNTSLIT